MLKGSAGTFRTALVLIVAVWSQTARAQDYVGILPELVKPEVSERLGLSDEQRDKIQDLIRTRTSGAIELSQKLREAPYSQQQAIRDGYSRESEELAYALFDADQKDAVAKYRVEWMGMLSMTDPAIADALNLDDIQREAVQEWALKVRRNRRGPSAAETKKSAERALRNEITDSQYAMWQLMAGQIEKTTSGPPMPPKREEMVDPATVAAGNDETGGEIASASDMDPGKIDIEDVRLAMNFSGAKWSKVLDWLAKEADLSLETNTVPVGVFNYRDRSKTYSVTEALDIMNGTLIRDGYTLLRSGRLLRVVDLEADQEFAGEFIREVADIVDAVELQKRGASEPVTHYFNLTRLDPDELQEDAEKLISINGTAIAISATGQLVVTDLAKNVRAIGQMIETAENSGRGSSVTVFPLKHVNAEEVLMASRPLLGLEEGINVSDNVSISTSTFGDTIYVKGESAQVQILRDMVDGMDKAPEEDESFIETEQPLIRRHRVIGIDVQLAYEVIAQMLAGSPEVKLAKDEAAKQLVLLATPSNHKLVEDTLKELSNAEADEFEVIELDSMDVQVAIAAVNKFFGITEDGEAEGQPVIDGDLLARQLWVKGSAEQVRQIKEFLENLETNSRGNSLLNERILQIPLRGRAADDAIMQAMQLWGQVNSETKIRDIRRPASRNGLQERSFAPEKQMRSSDKENAPANEAEATDSTMRRRARNPFVYVTAPVPQEAPQQLGNFGDDIVIMDGPNGIIVTSENKEALKQFDELMRLIADTAAMSGGEPVVVYLQNIKAEAAKELLDLALEGGSDGGSGGSLLGDMVGSTMGGMFGNFLSGGTDLIGGGAEGSATGDYTIIADPRLNALIIRANAVDMRQIELLLEVIDQVESPIDTTTRGTMKMIPVISNDVDEVAAKIKELLGDRMQSAQSAGGGGRGGGQPNPADIINALRGGGRRGGGASGGQSQLTEPKISLATMPETNVLIVYAQPQDIELVEDIVRQLDLLASKDPEEISVTGLGGMISGNLFADSIGRLLGPQAKTNVTPRGESGDSSSSSAGGSGGSSAVSDAQRQAQRAAFFERLRQGGAFGGGSGRPGGTTGGSTRGGGPGGGGFGRGGGGGPGRGGR